MKLISEIASAHVVELKRARLIARAEENLARAHALFRVGAYADAAECTRNAADFFDELAELCP